jgi:hypothetical protein
MPAKKVSVKLNAKAAARFRIAQWPHSVSTRIVSAKFGEINLETIRPESIEQLIGRGCPYFKAKKAAAKAETTAEATTHE